MLQTKASDLMELFVQLFDTSDEARTDPLTSTLVAPMAVLASPPVPLSEILGADGSVLTNVLTQYAILNAPKQVENFSKLSQLIAEDKVDFPPSGEPTKRLLNYAYPVV